MTRRGQVVVIIAFLIPVVLLLMAVGVDAGRIYLARADLQRAAESAASAGISVIADRMVTQVVIRKTEVAGLPSTPMGATATPEPGSLTAWLTDEDRATLVAPAVASDAEAAARSLLAENGVDAGIDVEFEFTFPQAGYDPGNTGIPSLICRVGLKTRIAILLAGLLYDGWTRIDVVGEAAIPQR
jgi:uncharacterized membrane protein